MEKKNESSTRINDLTSATSVSSGDVIPTKLQRNVRVRAYTRSLNMRKACGKLKDINSVLN